MTNDFPPPLPNCKGLTSPPRFTLTSHYTTNISLFSQIHFDLAVYHYMGRFEEDRVQDGVSSVFHLEKAAMCGLSTAEFTLGN